MHVDDTRACLSRIPKKTLLEIVTLPNDIGNATGKRNERRTLDAILALRASNPALVGARMATKEEDTQGVDIVVETAFGTMFVQVKSNKADARLWRKKYAATIGPKTLLVRWDGDRIVAPTNLLEALQNVYMNLPQSNESQAAT
jgi:hypothetical protein